MKNTAKSFILITLIFFSSCSGLVDSFGKMTKIKDSIETVYPSADVGINITNGTYINVSLINSDLNNKSEEEKRKAAEKISRIVKSYYKDKQMQGRLYFVKQKNYIIYKESQSVGIDLDLNGE